MRSARVSPPREECESFLNLFWADYALSKLNSGDMKNQYDFYQVESIFEIIFVAFLCKKGGPQVWVCLPLELSINQNLQKDPLGWNGCNVTAFVFEH